MVRPHRQAFAVALLEIRSAHHRPGPIGGEDAAAGLDLVAQIGKAKQAGNWVKDCHEKALAPWVDVAPIPADVPATRKDQPDISGGKIKDGLSGSRRIALHAPRYQNAEDPVASRHGLFDDRSIIGPPGKDRNPVAEACQLVQAYWAADTNDLVAQGKRMLVHVLPQLA